MICLLLPISKKMHKNHIVGMPKIAHDRKIRIVNGHCRIIFKTDKYVEPIEDFGNLLRLKIHQTSKRI